MTQASTEIAKQYMEGALNKKNWGAVAYNVLVEGLIGDGVTNDTAALQALINKAIAANRRTLLFPHGQYYVTALTNADQVDFVGDNSSFVGGYTGIIGDLGGFAALEVEFNAFEADYAKEVGKVFNIVGYGAVANQDSTAAIQAAINAAQTAGGGIVFIPPGIYILSSVITANSSVILEGAGLASILRCDAVIDKMISLQGTIKNLRVNGNLKAAKGISLDGHYTIVENCYIEYCTNGIYNNATDGHNLLYNITVNNTYAIYSADRFINVVIDGHQSRAGDGYGIYCTYTAQQPQGIRITNSLFFGNTTGAIKFAKDAYEIEISNNMIDGCYGICIDIAGSPTFVSQCYKISNNFIAPANSVSGGVGIWIRPGARDIVITGNTITLASYYGILIEATALLRCSSISIRDNKFNANDRQTGSGDLYADSVEDLVIDANRFLTSTGNSLALASSFSGGGNANILNNRISRPVSLAGISKLFANRGYVSENGGSVAFNGTGSQTIFQIPHGLSALPTIYNVNAGSAASTGGYFLSVDATYLYVTYGTAPVSGTNNVSFRWSARLS